MGLFEDSSAASTSLIMLFLRVRSMEEKSLGAFHLQLIAEIKILGVEERNRAVAEKWNLLDDSAKDKYKKKAKELTQGDSGRCAGPWWD